MVNPAGGGRPSRSIFADLPNRLAKAASRSQQRTFEQQLDKTLSGSGTSTPTPGSVPNRHPFAVVEQPRQDPVAVVTPEPVSPPAVKAAAATDPLEVLREAMVKAGIGESVQLSISDEMVGFPGGTYRNHLVRADFGGGVTESYSVNLMMKNPWLTAFEMKRLMGQS